MADYEINVKLNTSQLEKNAQAIKKYIDNMSKSVEKMGATEITLPVKLVGDKNSIRGRASQINSKTIKELTKNASDKKDDKELLNSLTRILDGNDKGNKIKLTNKDINDIISVMQKGLIQDKLENKKVLQDLTSTLSDYSDLFGNVIKEITSAFESMNKELSAKDVRGFMDSVGSQKSRTVKESRVKSPSVGFLTKAVRNDRQHNVSDAELYKSLISRIEKVFNDENRDYDRAPLDELDIERIMTVLTRAGLEDKATYRNKNRQGLYGKVKDYLDSNYIKYNRTANADIYGKEGYDLLIKKISETEKYIDSFKGKDIFEIDQLKSSSHKDMSAEVKKFNSEADNFTDYLHMMSEALKKFGSSSVSEIGSVGGKLIKGSEDHVTTGWARYGFDFHTHPSAAYDDLMPSVGDIKAYLTNIKEMGAKSLQEAYIGYKDKLFKMDFGSIDFDKVSVEKITQNLLQEMARVAQAHGGNVITDKKGNITNYTLSMDDKQNDLMAKEMRAAVGDVLSQYGGSASVGVMNKKGNFVDEITGEVWKINESINDSINKSSSVNKDLNEKMNMAADTMLSAAEKIEMAANRISGNAEGTSKQAPVVGDQEDNGRAKIPNELRASTRPAVKLSRFDKKVGLKPAKEGNASLGLSSNARQLLDYLESEIKKLDEHYARSTKDPSKGEVYPELVELTQTLRKYIYNNGKLTEDEIRLINAINTDFNDDKLAQAKIRKQNLLSSITGKKYSINDVDFEFESIIPLLKEGKVSRKQKELFKGSMFSGMGEDASRFQGAKNDALKQLEKINNDIKNFSAASDILKGSGTKNYARTYGTTLKKQSGRILELERELERLRGQQNPDESRIDQLEREYFSQMAYTRKTMPISYDKNRANVSMAKVLGYDNPTKFAGRYEDWEKLTSYYEEEEKKSVERQKLFMSKLAPDYKRPQAYVQRLEELEKLLAKEFEVPSGKYSENDLLDMRKEVDYLKEYRSYRQEIVKPLNELYKGIQINPSTKIPVKEATNVQDIVDSLRQSITHVHEYLTKNLLPTENAIEIKDEFTGPEAVSIVERDAESRIKELEDKKVRLLEEENLAFERRKEEVYESLIDLPKEIELQKAIVDEKRKEYNAEKERRQIVEQMAFDSDEEAVASALRNMIEGEGATIKDAGQIEYYKKYLESGMLSKDLQKINFGRLKAPDVTSLHNPDTFRKGTREYDNALEKYLNSKLISDITMLNNRVQNERAKLSETSVQEKELNEAIAKLDALKEELANAQKIVTGYTEKNKKGKIVEVAPFQKIIDEHNENLRKIGVDIDKSVEGLNNPPTVQTPIEANVSESDKIVNGVVDASGELTINSPHVTVANAEKAEVIKTGVVNITADTANGTFGETKAAESDKGGRKPITKYEADALEQKISRLMLINGNGEGAINSYSMKGLAKLKDQVTSFNNTSRSDLDWWKRINDTFANLTETAKIEAAKSQTFKEMVDLSTKIRFKENSTDRRGLAGQQSKLAMLKENYIKAENLNNPTKVSQMEAELSSSVNKAVADKLYDGLESTYNNLLKTVDKNKINGRTYTAEAETEINRILEVSETYKEKLFEIIVGNVVNSEEIEEVFSKVLQHTNELKTTAAGANKSSNFISTITDDAIDRRISELESIMYQGIRDSMGRPSEQATSIAVGDMQKHLTKLRAFKESGNRSADDFGVLVGEGNTLSNTISNIKEINNLYQNTYDLRMKIAETKFNESGDTNYIKSLEAELNNAYDAIRDFGKSTGASDAFIESLLGSNSEYAEYGNKLARQIEKQLNDITKSMTRKRGQGFGYTDEFVDRTNALRIQGQEVVGNLNNIKNIDDASAVLKQAADLVDKLGEAFIDVQNMQNVTVKGTQLTQLLSKAKLIQSNTNTFGVEAIDKARIAEIVDELERLKKVAPEATDEVKGLNRVKYDNLSMELTDLMDKYQQLGLYGANMFTRISKSLKAQMSAQIARYFSLYDIIRYVRTGVETIKQLDTAMVELRKVTDGTAEEYANFRQEIRATAMEIAATNQDLISSAADWSRLGYSIKEATELAKDAQVFANVGDGVDISGATDMMITAMKAFKIEAEDAMSIVDAYNEIGNHFALSATDIGDAMQRSASVLAASNTSFAESIALITASDEILQDPEKVGASLRTLALRIRGAKSELEEMGEETEYVVQSTSKLRDLIKGYTSIGGKYEGFDIMEDENTFKSLADIIKGIGRVYDEMSDIDKTAMLEKLAGKNRANALAAMLTNYKQIDNVLRSIEDSEGSALEENAHIVDSIEGRLTTLKASAENFWQTFLNDDGIKNTITTLTELLNLLTKIIDKVGILPTITAIGAPVLTSKIAHPFSNYQKAISERDAISESVLTKREEVDDLVAQRMSLARVRQEEKEAGRELISVEEELNAVNDKEEKTIQELTVLEGKEAAATNALEESKKALGKAIAANVAILAVNILITALVKYAQKVKESQQAVRDLAKETKEANASLDDYTRRIGDAKEVLEDEKSTTEEIIEAKKQLVEIQNELNDAYDTYSTVIKDVNSSNEEIDEALISQRIQQINDTLAEAKNTKSNLFSSDISNEYEDALNAFFGADNGFALNVEGQWQTGYKNIEELMNAYRQIMRQYDENSSTYQWAADHVKQLEEDYDKYRDIALLYGESEAANDERFSNQYESLMKSYQKYLREGTEISEENFKTQLAELWQEAAEANNEGVSYWLKSMFGEFFDEINDASILEKWNNVTSSGNSYGSRIENILGFLNKDAEELITESDILSYLNGNEIKNISETQKAWLDLLQDTLDEAGYEWEEYGSLVHKFVTDGMLGGSDEEASTLKEIEDARNLAMSELNMTAEQFDSMGIGTNEELDIWRKIASKVSDADDAVKLYLLETSKLGKNLDASDVLQNMESQYKPVFDSLATAYNAIWTSDGFDIDKITSEQLEGVRSNIESLSTTLKEAGMEGVDASDINDFILTLSDASTTSEQAHEAFNNLATVVVDRLNPAMAEASGETAQLMINTLKEMGVTNAEEVVYSRLGYTAEQYAAAKEAAAEIGFDLDDDISSLSAQQLELMLNSEALQIYYQGKLLANSENIETTDDVKELIELAEKCGYATVGIYKLADAKRMLGQVEIAQRNMNNSSLPDYVRKEAESTYNRLMDEMSEGMKANVELEMPEVEFDGSTAASSTSGGSESKQKFDWIERAIKKIQRAITNLGKIADATYKKWEERLGGVAGKYEKLQEEIILQQQAADAYMQEAMAVGLNPEYMDKVMNGLMDIETVTDERLKEQISDFQEYYDKATDASDAVEDLRGELAQLAQAKFDNITKQFEEMALSIDHAATRIGHIQDKLESEGYFESSALITQLKAGTEERLGQLKEEAKQLAASIDEAVTNGDIEYGSEQWWSMWDALQNVNDEIVEATSSLADYNDQLRQMEWDNFDYMADAVHGLVEENDFLIEVLQDEQKMFEKNALIGDKMYANGNMSDAAFAVQGLHVNSLKVYEEENKKYAKEIEKINAELANDPNNKKLLERRKELNEAQRNSIKGITSEKKAIVDLIKEGYETFLDYLQKSIDKRKEILEAQKSLYDYEKNIKDQTKVIATYQKQLAALGGDTSEENKARLQELTDNLANAEEELRDTEYERWLSDQEEMMDNLYSDFEKLIDDKLDNVDELITRAINQTATSSADISRTIEDEFDNLSYDLNNTSFGINMDARMSDAITAIRAVENSITAMIDAANINAQNELASLSALAQTVATQAMQKAAQIPQATVPTGNTGGGGSGSGGNNKSTNGTGVKTSADNTDKAKKSQDARRREEQKASYQQQISNLQKDYNELMRQYNALPNSNAYQAAKAQLKAQADEIDRKIKNFQRILESGAYAKGGLIGNAIKKTGEDGIILARSGEEVLSVERVKQMQEVFKMMQPLANMSNSSVLSDGTTINGMNVSFSLPNVTNYEDFVNQARKDPKFEKLVQSMTIGASLGKSSLSKYSI